MAILKSERLFGDQLSGDFYHKVTNLNSNIVYDQFSQRNIRKTSYIVHVFLNKEHADSGDRPLSEYADMFIPDLSETSTNEVKQAYLDVKSKIPEDVIYTDV